jgi:hypothetical protein
MRIEDENTDMRSLSVLLLVHAVLSLLHSDLLTTVAGSLMLVVFMGGTYRFSDWKSVSRGIHWLKQHPRVLLLVTLGTMTVPVLLALNASAFPNLLFFAPQQMIFAFFLFLGFSAAGLAFWNTGIKQIAYWLGIR